MGVTPRVVRALRTKETRNPTGTQNFGRPRRSTPTSFVFFWKGERKFFLLFWKDASRSAERRFHQEGRGRQPPIREPVRGDVPQRPRARGRRREVRPGRERDGDPARSRHALVLRQLHSLLWSRVACLHRLRRPGNYQADIQSGAQTGYSQNWVILWTQLLSWYVQYMCVKIQHYTNTNLAEAMALQYPKYVRWMFWVIAEVSIILTDLPEVIGFAIAIHLFNPSVPLYAGVLLSFLTTMLFLATLHKGSYFIELTACALVVIMSIVLFVEWDMSPTNSEDFLKGAFLPILPMTPGAIQSIIQIIGAVVMPHNLYLHSGALETRRCPPVDAYKRQAVKLGLWDPFIPILSTTVVNWAIASLAAIYVYGKNIPDADGLGIASFPKYLDVKGGTIMWGIALIAAAQSSCITTTYSGQFVMDGFLKINIPKWSRAIITRCVAVVPRVAVAAAFTNDTKALETMVDIVNSSLAFLLPFALIPLVKLTCSKQYMGEDYVAGKIETVVIVLATILCFGINFYTLVAPGGDYFGQYTSDMNIVGVQMNIVQDIVCIFYTACCVYMTFVPVRGSPLPIRKSLKPVDEEEEHAVAATDSMSDQKKAIVEMGKK